VLRSKKWLVLSPRSSIGFLALASDFTLRAHAARNSNFQVGLNPAVRRIFHE
jgi:hypothetical protein